MTLNNYIIEEAIKNQDASFLRKFDDTEVFFSIIEDDKQIPEGPVCASKETQLRIPVAHLDIGRRAVCYTSNDDHRLSNKFGGMPLYRALEMVCGLIDVDGILIQSDEDAWFSADKDAIKNIL